MLRFIVIMMICMLLSPVAFCQEQVVKIGVLKNVLDDKKNWEPTTAYLSNKIPQYKFEVVYLDFDKIELAVKNKQVDFLFCNPEFYIDLEAAYGISRIATIKNTLLNSTSSVFGGVIFTRADNKEIYTIKDLHGKSFAAVHPNSLGGWLVAWREIKLEGMDPHRDFKRLTFSGQHDLVVFDVLEKRADAGTVRTDILERMAYEGKIHTDDFRVISSDSVSMNKGNFPFLISTRLYPEWPFAKLQQTNEQLATQVAVALLSMPSEHPAAWATGCGGWSYPLSYQSVRELEMDLKIGYYREFSKLTYKDFFNKYRTELLVSFLVFVLMSCTIIVAAILNKRLYVVKQNLRVNEARLVQAQAIAHVGNWELNLADKTVWGSEEAFRIYGLERKSPYMPLDMIQKCVHSEDRPQMDEALRRLLQEKQPYNEEFRIIRTNDGEVRYIHTQAELIYDSKGRPQQIMGVLQDITERKQAEKLLRESEERFRLIFESAPFPFVIKELSVPAVLHFNQRAEEMFGVSKDLAIGKCGVDYYDDPAQRMRWLEEVKQNGFVRDVEVLLKRENGERFWALISAAAVSDSNEDILLVGINDISERKKLEEELKHKATIDGLTGIPNRMYFMDLGEQEWQRSVRYNHPFTLLTIDIDYFKRINDTWGHQAGDKVLQTMAHATAAALRKIDIFGRIGGEEFAVILPETKLVDAVKVAERIRVLLEETDVSVNEKTIRFTVSIGAAERNADDTELDSILKRSDKALYLAKNSGRNRVASC